MNDLPGSFARQYFPSFNTTSETYECIFGTKIQQSIHELVKIKSLCKNLDNKMITTLILEPVYF